MTLHRAESATLWPGTLALAHPEGICSRNVLLDDDVAVENSLHTQGRHGVGASGSLFGTFFLRAASAGSGKSPLTA